MTADAADPVLQALLARGRASTTQVTLLVGGAVITGTLARTSDYFQRVALDAVDFVDWTRDAPSQRLIPVHESVRDRADGSRADRSAHPAVVREALERLDRRSAEISERAAAQIAELAEQVVEEGVQARAQFLERLDDEDRAAAVDRASFLNLTDARYQLAGGAFTVAGSHGHIRVRTSAVDAWFPGPAAVQEA